MERKENEHIAILIANIGHRIADLNEDERKTHIMQNINHRLLLLGIQNNLSKIYCDISLNRNRDL